jgi:hypothetical protein
MELEARQLEAIGLLAKGVKMKEVAQQIGVSARSLRRWKQAPEFKEEYRDAIGDISDDMRRKIVPLIDKIQREAEFAFDRNHQLMASTNLNAVTRGLNIASNHAIKWIKLDLAMEQASNGRQLAAVLNKLEKMGCGNPEPAIAQPVVAQASSLRESEPVREHAPSNSPEGPDPSSETRREDAGMTASGRQDTDSAESGQKRTSENPPDASQPQSVEIIKAACHPTQPVSAPAPETHASGREQPAKNGIASTPEAPLPAKSQTWSGKGSGHVPFYKNIGRHRQHR